MYHGAQNIQSFSVPEFHSNTIVSKLAEFLKLSNKQNVSRKVE